MDVLKQIFAFAITVLVLVSIHEAGHFFVARWVNVKVLRYSIGFGRPIWTHVAKNGIEYVISWVPLGGYVKLLDEREEAVPEKDKKFAFNRQPLWKRFVIVAAGPITNLLFAIVAFWLMFVIGFQTYRPVIGKVLPDTAAAAAGLQAGSEIVEFDETQVSNWQDAMFAMVRRMGEDDQVTLVTSDQKTGKRTEHIVHLANWKVDSLNPEPLRSFGILPFSPDVKPVIKEVDKNSPADIAGIKSGDEVTSIDNKEMTDWSTLARYLQQRPGQQITLTVNRNGKSLQLPVTIGKRFVLSGWRIIGRIGVKVDPGEYPENMKLEERYGLIDAIPEAFNETFRFFGFNFVVIKKMFMGEISLKSLGGPITIFRTADKAFTQGLVAFLGFLALISVMLAFVNVLPIPGLDGGHLLYFLIEAILRRPLSMAAEVLTMRIGITMLVLLMVGATMNDILRLFN